jgi:hypothetical protein
MTQPAAVPCRLLVTYFAMPWLDRYQISAPDNVMKGSSPLELAEILVEVAVTSMS